MCVPILRLGWVYSLSARDDETCRWNKNNHLLTKLGSIPLRSILRKKYVWYDIMISSDPSLFVINILLCWWKEEDVWSFCANSRVKQATSMCTVCFTTVLERQHLVGAPSPVSCSHCVLVATKPWPGPQLMCCKQEWHAFFLSAFRISLGDNVYARV